VLQPVTYSKKWEKTVSHKENTEKLKIFKAFCKKYKKISPIIIFKTLQYSKTLGGAFDCLEDFNGELPITWNDNFQKWVPEILLEYELLNNRDE
jgi:hypothetical protein